MPADIDVLLAGTSPISFSTSYHPFSRAPDYSLSLNTAQASTSPRNIFVSTRSAPLDFPTALGCSPRLSHSPPIFSASSPTHYTFHGRCNSPSITLPSVRRIPNKTSPILMPVAVPRRPCLVVRCEDPFADMLYSASPNKLKKKVVFADDRGFPLTKVRDFFNLYFFVRKNKLIIGMNGVTDGGRLPSFNE